MSLFHFYYYFWSLPWLHYSWLAFSQRVTEQEREAFSHKVGSQAQTWVVHQAKRMWVSYQVSPRSDPKSSHFQPHCTGAPQRNKLPRDVEKSPKLKWARGHVAGGAGEPQASPIYRGQGCSHPKVGDEREAGPRAPSSPPPGTEVA